MELISVSLIFSCLLNIAFSADVKVEVIAPEEIVKYNLTKDLVLQCNVKNGNATALQFVWKKDDKDVVDTLKDRATYSSNDNNVTLTISKATDDDAGNYTCISKDGDSATIRAATTIQVNTPENVNVVEGEKLRIVCAVVGKPVPEISWSVGEINYSSSSGHVTLLPDPEKNITNAVLLIDNVNITHKGPYKCIGRSLITNETVFDEAMVRVKDKYAALWPFLGICLEVFVLCAIILIYEKKRNKTELEESDTDQSPDQKNTPDHGKDSNLRHRQ
ncbi:neuroplastin [Onthophagus taurus]|uniref:neuroplastin n=1 Tax=Onthophagus taurus TaxID=166361 RepID=UPI000C20BBD3|nr:neuroplastin [Onthophagus taurus]